MAGRRLALHTLDDAFNIRSIFAIRPVAHAGMPGAALASAFYLPTQNTVRVVLINPARPWQTEHFYIGHQSPSLPGAKAVP